MNSECFRCLEFSAVLTDSNAILGSRSPRLSSRSAVPILSLIKIEIFVRNIDVCSRGWKVGFIRRGARRETDVTTRSWSLVGKASLFFSLKLTSFQNQNRPNSTSLFFRRFSGRPPNRPSKPTQTSLVSPSGPRLDLLEFNCRLSRANQVMFVAA